MAIVICALAASLNRATTADQGSQAPPTSRFELQLYKQGNSMDHPQDTPPSLSIEYRSVEKASKATVLISRNGADHSQELGVEGDRGKADYKHFWGHDLAGQPSLQPGLTEWAPHSLMTFSDLDQFDGTYTLTSGGQQAVLVLGQAQSTALAPTSIPAVRANPADGFEVTWTPVEGAIGYKVCARQGSYPNYTEWNNSNQDWLSIGSEQALAEGVLLKDTRCKIPAGIFEGPVYVDVQAVSVEANGRGQIPSVAWSESNMSIEVGK